MGAEFAESRVVDNVISSCDEDNVSRDIISDGIILLGTQEENLLRIYCFWVALFFWITNSRQKHE